MAACVCVSVSESVRIDQSHSVSNINWMQLYEFDP